MQYGQRSDSVPSLLSGAISLRELSVAVVLAACCVAASEAPAKTVVQSETDLPRSVYAVKGSASGLLFASDAEFSLFVDKVDADVRHLLEDYEITDRTTQRQLLGIQLSIQEYRRDTDGALATLEHIRALEDKPSAKLLSGVFAKALLEAMRATQGHQAHAQKGRGNGALAQAYRANLEQVLPGLPWNVVGEDLASTYSYLRLLSRAQVVGGLQSEIDPQTKASGTVDRDAAEEIIAARVTLRDELPLSRTAADVLQPWVAQHREDAKSIWPQREVTLTDADKLAPTLVAIWDSGIDPEDFPGQMFDDPNPSPSGNHGYAFTDEGQISHDWTFPLKPAWQKRYPVFVRNMKGSDDILNGIQSPEAIGLEHEAQTDSVEEVRRNDDIDEWLGHYVHGTHCAGIAVRGNPAARLVVARFDDELPYLPFRPTRAWASRMAENFKNMTTYLRERHVRVVNMSWGDQVSEFETWLSKTGGGADAAARKKEAEALYAIWKDGVEAAIRNAPDTLFIAAAGNDDINSEYVGDVPSSLHEPNLISIGAVDDAGRETSFTSFGPNVLVYADGYEVYSNLPQRQHGRLSGTSMAAPNAVNLAAKLFALDPSLTVADVIGLIRDGASASADGRYKLIDPKASVALLKQRTAPLPK